MSILDSIGRGVAASAFGTLAMDASLYRGYRRDGGTADFPGWEFSEGLVSWENAPGPALAAKRLLEGVFKHEVPPRYARFLNNATHWGFGLAAGAGYGLLLGSRRTPKVWYGVPFGVAVWSSGYVVLPLLGVYKPVWKYDVETLRKDLSAHLVFGTATAAAFRLLADRVDSDDRRRPTKGGRHGIRSHQRFSDPDGNRWLLQDVTARLPGRVDPAATSFGSASDLRAALVRAATAHGAHEKRMGGEYDLNWARLVRRLHGGGAGRNGAADVSGNDQTRQELP